MTGYKTVRQLAVEALEAKEQAIENARDTWKQMGLPIEKLEDTDAFRDSIRKLEAGRRAIEVMDESVSNIKEAVSKPKRGFKKIYEIVKENVE